MSNAPISVDFRPRNILAGMPVKNKQTLIIALQILALNKKVKVGPKYVRK